MQKRSVIIAAACVLWAAPALAGQADIGGSPYGGEHANREQGEHNREFGGMKGGYGEHKTYGYEREGDYRHHGEGMREGCKYVTVRQRQGDEIVVRHFRRCD